MQTRAAAKRLRDAERQSETSPAPIATTESLAPKITIESFIPDALSSQRSSERIAIARSLAESSGSLSSIYPSSTSTNKGSSSNRSNQSTSLARYLVRYIDDESDTVEPPRKRQRASVSRVAKQDSDNVVVNKIIKPEDEKAYEPEDLEQYKSEVQKTRVTRRSATNNGYKIEQETTRKVRQVVTVTKTSSKDVSPFAKMKFGPSILTLRVAPEWIPGEEIHKRTGEFSAKLKLMSARRRRGMIYDSVRVQRDDGTWVAYKIKFRWTPYVYHTSPTPPEVVEVFLRLQRWLLALDGTDYQMDTPSVPDGPFHAPTGTAGVDDIVKVMLSQATSNQLAIAVHNRLRKEFTYTDVHTDKEVQGKYPNYHTIKDLTPEQLEPFLARGGLFKGRAANIIDMLNKVYNHNVAAYKTLDGVELGNPPNEPDFVPGLLSLDFLGTMTMIPIFNWLLQLKGFGVKSAACILAFNFKYPLCVVDTHVLNFAKWLRWIPYECTDPDQAFNHLDARIPDEFKAPIHQLIWHHQQKCGPCRRKENHDTIWGKRNGITEPTGGAAEKNGAKKDLSEVCPVADLIWMRYVVRDKNAKHKMDENGAKIKKEKKEKKDKFDTDFLSLDTFKTAEEAASKGFIEYTMEMDDDFGASGKKLKDLKQWERVGVEQAMTTIKQTQTSIVQFFSKKGKSMDEKV